MKKIILLITLMWMGQSIYAQQKVSELPVAAQAQIINTIKSNFKLKGAYLESLCFNTLIMVKFKVTNGEVDSLDFSKGGTKEIKAALGAAFLSTNGLWKSKRGENLDNQLILVPVIISYSLGCPTAQDTLRGVKNEILATLPVNPYKDMQSALRDMLQFEKGSKPNNVCTLLGPIIFNAME